jgi:hypothetical protein
MELQGADHLYTLSILAITFATVSALVTVVRQIKGGLLSMADVHLLTTFISAGFGLSVIGMLPPTASLLGLSGRALWGVASGTAALILAGVIIRTQWERRSFTAMKSGFLATVTFVGLWIAVLILVVNALVPSIQGTGLHAAAVTLALGTVMWSFLRRLASLGGNRSDGDWDLKRG